MSKLKHLVCDLKSRELVADPHKLVENLVEKHGFRPGFRLDKIVDCGLYAGYQL